MLSKLKAFFAANNIQRRLLLIISMFIFSSIILVSLFSHLRFVADYTDQSAKDIQQVVEQVALNVDTYIDELARLCLSPYYNSSVMNYLDTRSSSSQEALDKRRSIEDYLRQVMITPREDILRVYIKTLRIPVTIFFYLLILKKQVPLQISLSPLQNASAAFKTTRKLSVLSESMLTTTA